MSSAALRDALAAPKLVSGGSCCVSRRRHHIPGTVIISIGSCPWPGPWSWPNGAHLVLPGPRGLNTPSRLRGAATCCCFIRMTLAKSRLRREARTFRAELARAAPDAGERAAANLPASVIGARELGLDLSADALRDRSPSRSPGAASAPRAQASSFPWWSSATRCWSSARRAGRSRPTPRVLPAPGAGSCRARSRPCDPSPACLRWGRLSAGLGRRLLRSHPSGPEGAPARAGGGIGLRGAEGRTRSTRGARSEAGRGGHGNGLAGIFMVRTIDEYRFFRGRGRARWP